MNLRLSPFRLIIIALLAAVTAAFSQSSEEPKRNLAKLGLAPDWSLLDPYQNTITRATFEFELLRNYAERVDAVSKFIEILPDRARIMVNTKRPDQFYELHFATETPVNPPVRYWREAWQLPALSDPDKPLENMRIVIDPGHIGGEWAKMEARWFQIGDTVKAVKEGEMALRVGQLLRDELTRLGARVALVRRGFEPVTDKRPGDFIELAKEYGNFPPDTDPNENTSLLRAAERLFYVSDEIRARAKLVNDVLKPDLALCLHFNAEAWGNPAKPDFVDKNHFHILINGCYSEGEILHDDERFEMIRRLLQRTHPEELAVSTTVAGVMSKVIDLPAYRYTSTSAKMVGESPYVWSRNLLATRAYECPVVYFEPYVMNNRLVHDRVQAGEYPRIRKILDAHRPNLVREYAEAVAAGLAEHYRQHRRRNS